LVKFVVVVFFRRLSAVLQRLPVWPYGLTGSHVSEDSLEQVWSHLVSYLVRTQQAISMLITAIHDNTKYS